jgi:hypothetical protein
VYGEVEIDGDMEDSEEINKEVKKRLEKGEERM